MDFCPRIDCNGKLVDRHQTATIPEFAFSYKECPLCGWNNYEQRADENEAGLR